MRAPAHNPASGFTLIEVMIVVVIVGILASIALPSFMDQMRKSRRTDALQSLRALQLAQERYRGNNPSYGTLAQISISADTPGGRYTLAVSNPTAVGYTATATAKSGSSQTADKAAGVSCATLTVNQDAPVFNPAGQSACWGQ